jgi:hypothetical protein
MPYPGTIATRLAAERIEAASSAVALLTGCRFLLTRGSTLNLPEAAEEHVRKRTVHGFGHDDGEDETRRSVKRPSDNKQLAVENESHGRSGKARVGIQERDNGGHVRPADRDNQHHAEYQGNKNERWEKLHLVWVHHQDDRNADS